MITTDRTVTGGQAVEEQPVIRLDRDPDLDKGCPPHRRADDALYAAWVLNVVATLPVSRDAYSIRADQIGWDGWQAEARKIHAWIAATGATLATDDDGKAVVTLPSKPRTAPEQRVTKAAASPALAVLEQQATIEFTAAKARRMLRIVVAAYGRNHRIRLCGRHVDISRYCWQGRPMCMVGVALYLAGVSEDELTQMDYTTPTVIGAVRLPMRIRMTRAARRVFAAAQGVQDQGTPWGEALDAALAVRPYQRTAVAA